MSTSTMMAPLLSFIVTFFTLYCLIKIKAFEVLDRPKSRSLHTKAVSRIGGIGIVTGIVAIGLIWPTSLPDILLICAGALILISFADDIWQLPVWSRLFIHIIAATSLSYTLFSDTDHQWLTILSAIIILVWVSNLYNFMDGSDGLAGGMTLIGFAYYGLFASLNGHHEFAMIHFSIATAALAFLCYNFHPARIFMGDVGAIPLGFMAAAFGILGWINQIWSIWLPLLIFSPFIIDATVTLTKRYCHGENIFQPHCQHYYQKLVRNKLGHRGTALLYYVLMLAVGASAIWGELQGEATKYMVAVMWSGIYLSLMFYTDRCLLNTTENQNVRK